MAQVNDACEIKNPIQSTDKCKSRLITAYLMQRSLTFADLKKLRTEIANNPEASEYFQFQQKQSDETTPNTQAYFMKMMQQIAREMDEKTQFLTDIKMYKEKNLRAPPPKVLDLCMAPGGFSKEVRNRLPPLAEIYGITLPVSLGGHFLLLEKGPRLNVELADITMLAAEMGVNEADIPSDHPDQHLFVFDRPYFGRMFDLILCDGQVLRTHKRKEYRQKMEALRLKFSQLIFALQHIKTGGTFVILLHRVEKWTVLKVVYAFTKFCSNIQLFKPERKHALRPSFYLVAKGVKPQEPAALSAIKEWKEIWKSATFDYSTWDLPDPTDDEVKLLLADFGDKLIEMFEPSWLIQLNALKSKRDSGFPIPNIVT